MEQQAKERFYSLDSAFEYRGVPYIATLTEGFGVKYRCKYGHVIHAATGKMVGRLDPFKGTMWPDGLYCGHFPFLIVSERVIDAWEMEGIGSFPKAEITIAPERPGRLSNLPPPKYFWIDGEKLKGALMDFDASGFVGVKFCPDCGQRSEDIHATYQHRMRRTPFVFKGSTWTGLNLFTTDLSPTWYFCTSAVVECVRRHKFTNIQFVPIEEGHG